jgi:hypothetical protein
VSVSVQVWAGKASTIDEFENARDARHHVLTLAQNWGAEVRGNGSRGALVVGEGIDTRAVAVYEIV